MYQAVPEPPFTGVLQLSTDVFEVREVWPSDTFGPVAYRRSPYATYEGAAKDAGALAAHYGLPFVGRLGGDAGLRPFREWITPGDSYTRFVLYGGRYAEWYRRGVTLFTADGTAIGRITFEHVPRDTEVRSAVSDVWGPVRGVRLRTVRGE